MRKRILVILLGMIMLLAGCAENSDIKQRPTSIGAGKETTQDLTGEDALPEEFLDEVGTDYTWTELKNGQTHVSKPAGVCVFNDQIVVCDRSGNKLAVLDKEYNFVKEIGEVGSAPGEFLEPTGITTFGDKLYVIDAGNNRIQILDSEFEMVDTIALSPLEHQQGGNRYIDIAVDAEGIIYVSTDSLGDLDAYVYVIKDGEIQKSEQLFNGFFAEYNGEVYAADCLELSIKGDREIGATGKNYIYRMKGSKMEKVAEFPFKLAPSDWIFTDNSLFLTSSVWGQAYRFSHDFEPEKSIIYMEKFYRDMYITALSENDFIITCQQEDTMYYLHY